MADEENAGFSLADLADIDVSDIEEVRFQTIPAGSYGFEILESELEEYEKDGDRKFRAVVRMKINEVKAVLEAGVDKDSLMGREHIERLTIDPTKEQADVQKAIGRIRAFVADVGMPNTGTLGEIVRGLKGHIFSAKIANKPDKDDKTIVYARLKLDPAKK